MAGLAMLPVAVVCCSPAATSAAARVLRVAGQRGTLRAVMAVSGVLGDMPYRVEWSDFGAASPLLEALAAGAADIGGVGEAPFAFAYAAGAPIIAVLALATRGGGGRSVAIIVPDRSAIRHVADLAGRRVATVRGSVGHYLLIRAAQRDGIDPRRIETVFLAPGEAQAAMAAGSIDAWATWSPYIGIATARGDHRIVTDGGGLFSGLSYIAANREAVATRPELIADFLARLTRAQSWAGRHVDAYAAALAAETHLPLAVARDTITRQDMHAAPIDASMAASTAATLGHFRDAGVIPSVPDLAGAFTRRFNAAKELAS